MKEESQAINHDDASRSSRDPGINLPLAQSHSGLHKIAVLLPADHYGLDR